MMGPGIYAVLRNLQSRAPFIRPLKFDVYNLTTRLFGRHIEPEFRLLQALGPIELALDIGGNWGQSIWALKRTARPAMIHSFEPDRQLSHRLSRQFEHDSAVAIHHVALGAEPGSFTLFTPRYRDYLYDGLASLNREEAESWLPSRMARFNPDLQTIVEQKVEVRTLDSFGLTPQFVKIDVQGAELQVALGGLTTLRNALPIAIIESPSEELVSLLSTIGLNAYSLDRDCLSTEWHGATNVLFLTEERRKRLP